MGWISLAWQFPFSIFNFNKTMTYDADDIVIKQYQQDVEAFKDYFESHSKDEDVTTNWTPYILEAYERSWLLEKGPIDISHQDLDHMLFDLQSMRQTVMDLAFRGDEYGLQTKDYLNMVLTSILNIEDDIRRLKHSRWHSRKTLNRQIGNLQNSMMTNFDNYATFYKAFKEIDSQ